jgi:hypothetical protein
VTQADKSSKTQVQFANEGAEKKQQEEQVAARKRKVEDKEKWEGKSLFHPHVTPLPQSEILRVFSNRMSPTPLDSRHHHHASMPLPPTLSPTILLSHMLTLDLPTPLRSPTFHVHLLSSHILPCLTTTERREERVHDWRSYQAAPKKKKKKNEHVLG